MSGTLVQSVPLGYQAWTAARRAVIEAHAGEARLVALLGPAGIGKTYLLRNLEQHFREAGYDVERVAHGDLLTGAEATPILLVDEADRLDEAALAGLATRTRGSVVLAALPGFASRVEGSGAALVRLGPLREAEVADYVAARLAAMGLASDRVGADALLALTTASGGVPRLLNTLIGSSAFTADMEGDVRVTARHVEAAAALQAEVALPATASPGALPSLEPLPDPASSGSAGAPPATTPEPVVPARRRRRGLPWLGAVVAALLLLGGAAWLHQSGLPGAAGVTAPAEAADAALPLPRPTEVLRQALSTAASPPPAPSPLAALPAAPQPRVVLTYPRRDIAAAERSVALAATLTQAGWLVGTPFPVSRATGPALRYFFQEDREAALAVAALAGAEASPPKLGSIPPGTPLPRPGTIELALAAGPALPGRAGTPPDSASDPLPPTASLLAPADRAALPVSDTLLRWSVPGGGGGLGCCYVEVMALPLPGDAAPAREVFAGYGEQPDAQPLALGEPRAYAWRVITVSREGLRYAASPWASFTLGEAPR